ncbi:MAG: protein-disulfide reductase DsbD [Ferrovum sp.]|nr:protein-disulfide reductase DsbD [Ferrovum sp.]NDU86830.1 protein-disulfide reductase DsbD [Ferrovum sp.]
MFRVLAFSRPSNQFVRLVILLLSLHGGQALAIDGLPDHPPVLPAAVTPETEPRTFLMPDQAFKVAVDTAADSGSLILSFTPAPGYYLYRDRIRVQLPSGSPTPILKFPSAEAKEDPSFGQVWVYRHPFQVELKGTGPTIPSRLSISYQGCADHGICYPPTTQDFRLDGERYSALSSGGDMSSTPPAADSGRPEDFASYLKGAKPLLVLASFFSFGLLLALTPCVFPMIPILSGIIAGQGASVTKTRAFTLSLTYVMGMALTYAVVGVLAGLTGTLLSNALQTPPVQIATAVIFVLLALSMFDVYQLQLPLALQNRLTLTSNRLPGGHYWGVGFMGMLSSLVMGPCVAAPLAGGLLYIAQTHDVVLGGSALFTMALGMGMPLLVIGTSAGALLPRAGRWMNWVKRSFGVVLILVALFIILPLVRSPVATDIPPFTPVDSVVSLDHQLRQAAAEHRPVLVDFYADWCASCVEMDRTVLARPAVKKALGDFVRLRIDVTHNTAADHDLLAHFSLFGPPGTLFFDREGHEKEDMRLAGYIPEDQFLGYLDSARR